MRTADSCQGDVACSKYARGHPVPYTVFEAAPGEANRLEATRLDAHLVLRDAGAPLVALGLDRARTDPSDARRSCERRWPADT